MNEVDKLIVKIEADTKQLKSELDKIQGKIRVTGAAGGAAFAGLGVALKNLKGPALIAGAGIAADTFGFHKGESPEINPRLMLCAVYATKDYGLQDFVSNEITPSAYDA